MSSCTQNVRVSLSRLFLRINSMVSALLLLAILLIVRFTPLSALEVSRGLALSDFDTHTVSACAGESYFESSSFSCRACPANQTPDTSRLDGIGSATACKCKTGFKRIENNCAGIRDGSCQAFNCTSCLSEGLSAFSDHSACVPCDANTTLGLSLSLADCACPAGAALLETDAVGNKLPAKVCAACPSGTQVVLADTLIAGRQYYKDLHRCQSCPDARLMSMSLVNGLYSCRCAAGYTLMGVSGLGPQQCVSSADAAAFLQLQSAAKLIPYYSLGKQVSSLTMEHFYVVSATRCVHFSSAEDAVYCEMLANLCVLRLYDESSPPCKAHREVIAQRPAVNDVANWAQGSPWIYFDSFNGGEGVCAIDGLYQTSVSLRDFHMQYVVASYFLNGTLKGYENLDTFFSYCTRSAPFSGSGGGSASSTRWQYFATTSEFSFDCELRSLFPQTSTLTPSSRSEDLLSRQYMHELYLYDPGQVDVDKRFVPMPVRMMNLITSADGNTVSKHDFLLQYPATTGVLCNTEDILVRRFFLHDLVSGISALNSDPEVVRYASYIGVEVLRVSETQRGIYAPVLTIQYKETAPAAWPIEPVKGTTTNTNRRRLSSSSSPTTTTQLAANNIRFTTSPSFSVGEENKHELNEEEDLTTQTIARTNSVYTHADIDTQTVERDVVTTTNSLVSISFTAFYTTDLAEFFTTLMGFFVAQLVVMIAFFALRYYNWNTRNSRVIQSATMTTSLGGINWRNIFEIVLIFLNSYVLALFPFQVLVSWYFFVFFKLQSVPSILLPLQQDVMAMTSPYVAFVGNLYLMTLCQVLYVLVMLVYRQSKNHLFFIDWEPRSPPSAQSASSAAQNARGQHREEERKVSVWRTIMVANEYVEMQTRRRTNIYFTLFFLVFFLVGLDLEKNAYLQPSLSLSDLADEELTSLQKNIVLRFANTTFFWLVLSVGQYVWKLVIYERYFSEPPEQVFIDFCTIAKVSVLVLDERYHGYYLHCRSPHQCADSSMAELVEMLGKEEAGLTTDRSLEGAPSDVQSFELFLSSEWTTEFRRIKSQLIIPKTLNDVLDQRRQRQALILQQQQQQAQAQRGGSTNNALWGVTSRAGSAASAGANRYRGIKVGWAMLLRQTLPPEKVIAAWSEMLQFLQYFVENNLQLSGLRYAVRDPTYCEALLSNAPDLSAPSQPSVFFADRDGRFTSVWFLGQETNLLVFNVLVYSLCDLWFDNTCVSVLVCFLADWLIRQARHSLGQAVLTRNTLIDGRFLI